MDIQNKVIVVSGGCSGLGRATAEYCLQQGAQVALLDINEALLTTVAEELNVPAFVTDVTDAAAVEQAAAAICDAFGDVHVVVNCAGVAPAARMVGRSGPMPLQDFERVIHINLIGTFNVMRVLSAKMMQQQPLNEDGERGVIINTASVAAFDGQIGQAAYSASKGGVVAMTLPLARELSSFGIRVMTIAPGVMETPMMAGMPEKVTESLEQIVPFPKRLGASHEYAQLVAQIISNGYLNGEVIRLDGGIRMQSK